MALLIGLPHTKGCAPQPTRPFIHFFQHYIQNFLHLQVSKPLNHNHFVEPVQELWPGYLFKFFCDLVFQSIEIPSQMTTNIRCHYNSSILEIQSRIKDIINLPSSKI